MHRRGKKAQSRAAAGSDRATQPSPPKKLRSDQPTSPQSPAAGGSNRVVQPPVVRSSALERLKEFWCLAWGKEDAFKASQQGLDSNSVDYLDFSAHFLAVKKICPDIPDDGKLCILQEYIDAYTRFECETDEVYEKGVCITGQPGIGKTCFIAYAVVRRLREKLPVAVEEGDKSLGKYWLFTADGVFLGSDEEPLIQLPRIWAFSDSNSDISQPSTVFRNTPGVRTFQVTSPQEIRFKGWTKHTGVNRYYMNLPSENDMTNLSLVGSRDIKRMERLAGRWGPVPRTLNRMHDDRTEDGIEKETEDNLRAQLVTDVKEIGSVLDALNKSNGSSIARASSSTTFFIRPLRTQRGLNRRRLEVFVPTPWLQDQVIDVLCRQQESKKFELYNALIGAMGGRSAAGGIFERIIHSYFINNKELSVLWYTASDDEKPKPGPTERIHFGQLKALPTKQDIELASLPCYWHPQETYFPTIDYAILTKDAVYAIQVTTTATHSFDESGFTKFQESLKGRKGLLKGFIVIGHMENQTDHVTKDLIGKIKDVNKAKDFHVGAVTFDCSVLQRLRSREAHPIGEKSRE